MLRGRIFMIIGGMVLMLGLLRLLTIAPAPPSQRAEHLAPDVSLNSDMAGPPIHLSQFQGKVVVLDFWATWCGPCRMSIPELARLYTKYHAQGLEVFGISADHEEGRKQVPAARTALGITYPVVFEDDNPNITENYPADSLPTMVIIDRKGKVASYTTGLDPRRNLEAELVALLNQAP